MKRIFAALSLSLLAGACAMEGLDPGPNPGPGPRPEVRFVGTIVSKAGPCNIIRARNGRRFAVNDRVVSGLRVGTRVRGRGVVTGRQPCPGATRIRVANLSPVAGPGPGPRPGGFVFVGRVVEKAGRCHTIRANNGRRFAVDRGVLAGIPVGARVRIRAVRAGRQYCPGALRVQVRRLQRI